MIDVRLDGIGVHIGPHAILKKVDLRLQGGEVHALLGEHGAGKTTLCNIACGVMAPTTGSIVIDGERLGSLSIGEAHEKGIRLVSQTNPLVEHLSVGANLLLNNRDAMSSPWVSHRRLCRKARAFMADWNIDIDPEIKVHRLSEGERLVINILKSLYASPRLLVLDESFDKLSAAYLENIRAIIDEMTSRGMALLVVTHRVKELFSFAQHVTVLRAGRVLFQDKLDNTNSLDLIRLAYTQLSSRVSEDMAGREFYSLLKYNRAILERLPVNMIVLGETLNLKIVNDSARNFFGLAGVDVFNRQWSDIPVLGGLGLAGLLEDVIARPRQERVLNLPMSILGNDLVIDATVFPLFEEERFLGLILILDDVTEKERMREKFILAEKLTSVNMLSTGVAHEINNPLEIISNYIDHIRIRHSDIPEIVEDLEHIEEEISSISTITRNLISIGDSTVAESEAVEINGFLEELLFLLEHSAREKGIALEFRGVEERLHVSINRVELKQVILNIVKNAFEAMIDSGTLNVVVTNGSAGKVRVSFRDDGPGIGGMVPGDLFLPFVTTKGGSRGNLGLGLSLSYSMIQKHDGTISAGNHPDGGAEFVVELPLMEGV